MIHSDFSSDLDWGLRPELKSDEKSECKGGADVLGQGWVPKISKITTQTF